MSKSGKFSAIRGTLAVLGLCLLVSGWCGAVRAEDPPSEEPPRVDREFPDLQPPPPDAPETSPSEDGQSTQRRYLFQDSALERFGERYEDFKQRSQVPFTVSAWHWWHVDTGGPLGSGYGIPSTTNSAFPILNGTYYYSVEANEECPVQLGPFSKVGVYTDFRFRDGGTPLRPFYPNDTYWMQQGYVWAYAEPGVLKAGAVGRRFGLDWDGSWWGNVEYFDGFKLAYDWGVSWEVTPEFNDGLKVDRFFQFFVRDYLDGSVVGANPESVVGSSQRNTFVARVVPTVQLSESETFALGISGLVGEIQNADQLSLVGLPYVFASTGNQTTSAWAVDATYTVGNLKLFVEGMQSYGTLSPSNYVSFGPSDRITDLLAGVNWTRGPVTYRLCYSVGLEDHPSGTEHLVVPGMTVALTRNTEFYLEYVRQEVRHSGDHSFSTLENGLQLLLHWHF
jgi:hypothetical protein